jgi:4'-phosphopantetheinyl transferase
MVEVDAPTIRPWAPGSLTVRAREGRIDVWSADLTVVGDELEDLLCPEERERAARIVGGRERVLWARSRGVLRALLGRYSERDPRTLELVLGAHGKPALLFEGPTRPARPATGDLRFNLSHSGDLVLVAVTAGREVGVDLEVAPRRALDEPALAARVLGRAQAARLAELDPRTREREFLRAWVAHEATVKCRGLGLFTPPGDSPRTDLWMAELDVGPDAAGAMVAEGAPCEVGCWEWSG